MKIRIKTKKGSEVLTRWVVVGLMIVNAVFPSPIYASEMPAVNQTVTGAPAQAVVSLDASQKEKAFEAKKEAEKEMYFEFESGPLSKASETKEDKKIEKEAARDFEEYSFEDGLAQLSPDYAEAVVVKSLTAQNLKQLVELPMEVGIAVLKGKAVLFTSGGREEIRLAPAAQEMLSKAELIAHTHPKGRSGKPSLTDLLMAGRESEYVVSEEGVYAFNFRGLEDKSSQDYGALTQKINQLSSESISSKAARDVLHQFISSIEEQKNAETSVFRSVNPPAGSTVAASNPNFNFYNVTSGSFTDTYVFSQATGESFLMVHAASGESVPSMDVDPSGRYAFANVYSTSYVRKGYTVIFDLQQKSFIKAVDAITGQTRNQIEGVLYSAGAIQAPSAFRFENGIVIFSYHSGGYASPTGAYILNLRNQPLKITEINNVVYLTDPVVYTPQQDKLLFTSTGGTSIYDIATGRVDYQAGGGAIRALSADGRFAIEGSFENEIYVASIRNLSQATRKVTIPLPCTGYVCWSGRNAYGLKSAVFLNENTVEATLNNGDKVQLYLDDHRFDMVSGKMLSSSSTFTPKALRPLPTPFVNGKVFPLNTTVFPAGASVNISSVDRGISFNYITGTPGWAGGGLTYDDSSTPAIETVNLSGLGELRLGIRGNGSAKNLKVELVDDQNRKASIILSGIASSAEKVWTISTVAFLDIDLTKVRLLYFIVEGAAQSGQMDIFYYPPGSALPSSIFKTSDITRLPGSVYNTTVAPTGATASVSNTARGIQISYSTGTPGWAGGGFSFDNFSTSTVETQNLSVFNHLIFGVKGNPDQLKMEVVDNLNRKALIYLRRIQVGTEQVWFISTADVAAYGVDLTRVRLLYFIVEGANKTGTVEITRIPTPLAPSTIHAVQNINIPGVPTNVPIAPAGATAQVTGTTRGMVIQYNTASAGWAGGGFRYDNSATTAVETANLSGFTPLVIGMKGSASLVKFEVVDDQNRKASVYLTGISASQEQVWAISTTELSNYGVNMSKIKMIYLIVEGANQTGNLEVVRAPVYPPYPAGKQLSIYQQYGYGAAMPNQYFPIPENFLQITDSVTGQKTYRRIYGSESGGNVSIGSVKGVSPDTKYAVVQWNATTLYIAGDDLSQRAKKVVLPANFSVLEGFVNSTEARIRLADGRVIRLNLVTLQYSFVS